MEKLIYLIALAWLSNMIVWRFELKYYIPIRDWIFKILPFLNCTTCFAFYVGFIFSFLHGEFLLQNFLFGLAVSFIATIQEKYTKIFFD